MVQNERRAVGRLSTETRGWGSPRVPFVELVAGRLVARRRALRPRLARLPWRHAWPPGRSCTWRSAVSVSDVQETVPQRTAWGRDELRFLQRVGSSRPGPPPGGHHCDGRPRDGHPHVPVTAVPVSPCPCGSRPREGRPREGRSREGRPCEGRPREGRPPGGCPRVSMVVVPMTVIPVTAVPVSLCPRVPAAVVPGAQRAWIARPPTSRVFLGQSEPVGS